jgi:hypothetical protein
MSAPAIWSILLGTTLGILFATLWKSYRGRSIFKGPNSRHVQQQIYRDDRTGQHYKFHPVPHVCPPSVDVTTLDHSDDEDEESF